MAPLAFSASELVDFSKTSFWVSAASIAFNPLFWNIVARQEYHNKTLTKLFGGRSQAACYALAATIFSLGLLRDSLYERALREQPAYPLLLERPEARWLAYGLLASGGVLVASSTWALGVTGTFLGDYFGILMDGVVTGFPFSLTDAPMYHGATCGFAGSALLYGRPAGLLLTAWVLLIYRVALRYENPFTAGIYAERERERERAAAAAAKGEGEGEGKKVR